MKLMEEEKGKLQKEIDTMNSVINNHSTKTSSSNDDDIIVINAGGKIISVLRSTLCKVAPDTMFSYMFSGRWEESLKRDENGNVFIDENSQLIEIIIDFLRMKKRENPSNPIQPPKIPEAQKENFATLLDYYGLTDFFYPPTDYLPLDINNISVVQPHGRQINVTKSKNKIEFLKQSEGIENFYFIACTPSLNYSDEGSFWKVTINEVPYIGGLFLGIIRNLGPYCVSHDDSTSYGWAGGSHIYHAGHDKNGQLGFNAGFTQGECLYFHLKTNKLTMFSVQKNVKYTMNIATKVNYSYYIHFNIRFSGTKITLESLNQVECARLLV